MALFYYLLFLFILIISGIFISKIVVASEAACKENGLTPLSRIVAWCRMVS
jgi:hypothetical protein